MENISRNYINKHILNEGFGLKLLALYLAIMTAIAIKIGFDRKKAEKIANELLPIIKKDLDAGIKKASPKIASIGTDLYRSLTGNNNWKQLLLVNVFRGWSSWKLLPEKSKYEDYIHIYIANSMKNALYISRGKKVSEIGLQRFFSTKFELESYDDTYDKVYYLVSRKGIPEDTPAFEAQIKNMMDQIEKMSAEVDKADAKAAKILKPIYKLFFDNLEKLLKQKAKET